MTISELNKLNPNPGIPYLDYKKEEIINGKKVVKCKIYGWMLKDKSNDDIYVIQRTLVHYLKTLCVEGITAQLYFDVVVLGLTDESQRPRCRICGGELTFDCIGHGGYPATCSKACHKELKHADYLKNDKMMKEGGKHTVETLKKMSEATLRNKPWEDPEWKRKHSEYMKKFAKTPEGKAFYKYVGQKSAEANLKKSLDTNKPKHLYNSKLYKKGVYHSNIYNLDYNYDSGWELEFIKYMERDEMRALTKVFDRSRGIIPYTLEDGSKHKYLPDFFIQLNDGRKIVIEVKPYYLLSKDEKVVKKIKAGKDYYKNTKIQYLVLTDKEMLDHDKIRKDFDLMSFIK